MPEKPLYRQIYDFVIRIPSGRVSTYGRIAGMVGGCTARMVGYALASLPPGTDAPWHRVVNREGRISLRADGYDSPMQRKMLELEGVMFDETGAIDLSRYGWKSTVHPHPEEPVGDWPRTVEEARAVQDRLRSAVIDRDDFSAMRFVAGVDASVDREEGRMRAAAAVLDMTDLSLVECVLAERPVEFPYVPGYLSFREVPVVMDALYKLTTRPDIVVCDGQGLAHPKGFGLACHLGVVSGLPTIGAAKSRLIGDYAEPGLERGSRSELRYGGKTIGAVLRTRSGVKPLFVSLGHRVSLATAIDLVLRLTPKYRLPETTRQAHRLAVF